MVKQFNTGLLIVFLPRHSLKYLKRFLKPFFPKQNMALLSIGLFIASLPYLGVQKIFFQKFSKLTTVELLEKERFSLPFIVFIYIYIYIYISIYINPVRF